ncbi:MAG: sigma-70 family RNA polymerase sigma factor [bacterium]
MGIKIKPHPYRFRQDIEIEVIHAQRAHKAKDYDQFEVSIRKLKKFLSPLMEKWTQSKEIKYNPQENEEQESFETQEIGRTYYQISWIQFIESKEGFKGLSITEWEKLIDHVFKQRVLAYVKYGKKSGFLGYLYRWFYFYLLTAYRKIKVAYHPKLAHFNNRELQMRFTQIVNKLPKRQKIVFTDYYFSDLSYKEIAEKLIISESTVRNNKAKALKNIKKFDSSIYAELKRKYANSKGKFLK